MHLSVFGAGYVGLTAAVCFAEMGHRVRCMERDNRRREMLLRGRMPFYEQGMDELLPAMLESGALQFHDNVADTLGRGGEQSSLAFLAVPTPPLADGGADLSAVRQMADAVAATGTSAPLVIKSTVPPGTARALAAELGLAVLSNPEFLKEGTALADFRRPDRVIIGADDDAAGALLAQLYGTFTRRSPRILMMDTASAEMGKYAANAMLATRISFVNEVASLCDASGADVDAVRRALGSDRRIGDHFLYPGCGYGGTCLPKDLAALSAMGRACGCPTPLADAVIAVNARSRAWLAATLRRELGDLDGRRIAVWGLAYKPGTGDVREAPAMELAAALLDAGARLRAWDPRAMDAARAHLGKRPGLQWAADAMDAADDAEALVICTEWRQFQNPDFAALRRALAHPLIIDGRNLYAPQLPAAHGIRYICRGRPQAADGGA